MDCKLRAKNCGGCPLLGLDYAEQLKQKEEKVRALVGKYGPVHPIRGMEQPYHYRNKVISTFAPGFGGKLTSGIYAANSHKVLPVESCLLQDEVLDKTMQAVRAAANACRYQPYDEDKGTGLVRHCLLRRGVATGQVMVVLVTAQPVLPGAKNFVKALLTEAAQRGGGIVGTPSGFADLDKLTAGFEAGQLVILAARPGMGKTSIGLNICLNAAKATGKTVAIFSLEMSREQLVTRFLSSEGEIPLGNLLTGNLTMDEWKRTAHACAAVSSLDILVLSLIHI